MTLPPPKIAAIAVQSASSSFVPSAAVYSTRHTVVVAYLSRESRGRHTEQRNLSNKKGAPKVFSVKKVSTNPFGGIVRAISGVGALAVTPLQVVPHLPGLLQPQEAGLTASRAGCISKTMANYGRRTPAPDHGVPGPVRITAVDLSHAHDYVRNAPSISKWTKPQIVSAADGMAWLLRELPGSPKLLARLLDLVHGHPDPVIAMGDVANLVRAQSLDSSILEAEDAPPLMASTQRAAAAAEASAGGGGAAAATGAATAVAATAAATTTTAPAARGAEDGEEEEGRRIVGAAHAAAGGGAAAAAAVAAPVMGATATAGTASTGATGAAHLLHQPHPYATRRSPKKTTVCSYLWKRMLCRRHNCEYSHPDLCADSACIPTRAPNCAKFHGRYKMDKGGPGLGGGQSSSRKKKTVTMAKNDFQGLAQGNGRRGAPPPHPHLQRQVQQQEIPLLIRPPHTAPARGVRAGQVQEGAGGGKEAAGILPGAQPRPHQRRPPRHSAPGQHVQRRGKGLRPRPAPELLRSSLRDRAGVGSGLGRPQAGLRLIAWNVSSLARSASRELELEHLLDAQAPDVVVLTETELPVHDTTFAVKNYMVFLPDLSDETKFRLIVLVRLSLVPSLSPAVLFRSGLDLWLKLTLCSGPLVIGAVYRQWGTATTEREGLATLHEHAAAVAGSYSRAVLLGDLNLDVSRGSDATYYRHSMLRGHLDKLDDLGFHFVCPSSPTYYSHGHFDDGSGTVSQRCSTLDHVYALGGGSVTATTIPYSATDHLPVLAILSVQQPRLGTKKLTRRNYAALHKEDLICALNAARLSRVFYSDNVNVINTIIVKEIHAALDIVAPYKATLIKNRPTPLHLKPDTIRTMKERDLEARPGGDRQKYRILRNRVVRLLKRDKLDSNQKHLQQSGMDPKRVWTLANVALGRGTNADLPSSLDGVTGGAELAAHVNNFYVDKISKLRSGIDRSGGGEGEPEGGSSGGGGGGDGADGGDVLVLRPPSEAEVAREILKLRNTGAEGADQIPVAVLKMGVGVLAGPIAHLVATSITTAVVPDGFKLSNILPIHKKKKPSDKAASYRPVAILPALSKVLERVVHGQLLTFMEKKFPNCQHGFRPRRNTVGAIIASHGAWAKAKSAGKVVGIAAYDLSAAFDTLDHNKLLSKLHGLGIRGRTSEWFRNYLSGRQQRVVYNGHTSNYLPVRFGVPQGSVLGPVLFLCLLVDLPDVISNSSIGSADVGSSGYADDCIVWAAANDAATVKANLESVSFSINAYMSDHYLVLNHDKTQVVWVGDTGGVSSSPINIGGTMVSPSSTVDVLGVTFDSRLSPAPHLTSMLRSARSLAGASRRLSLHLRRQALQQVVRALLVGTVGYACAVLRPRLVATDPVQKDLAAIQTAINDCARAIIGSSRRDQMPIPSLLAQAGLPSLNRLIVEQVALETWKGMNYECNGCKVPIGKILCSAPPSQSQSLRPTRSRTTNCIQPPTKFKCDTFAWYAYRLWNGSPPLRSANTLSNARRAAKELAALAPI